MIPSNVQQDVAEEVNNRLTRATQELQAKYARGEGGNDVSVDGPTGEAYKQKNLAEQKKRKEKRDAAEREEETVDPKSRVINDDDEDEGDEDSALRELREQRLRQLKSQRNQTLENLARGHGQYREIVQDEFLSEVTSSATVICHFYHRDFSRCTIVDHHISRIVQRHIESKFIKINAEKAPFFVDKLKIRTIPTLCIFQDGVCVDKIVGFEGLADEQPEGKEDEWPTIRLARLLAKKGAINGKLIVDDEGVEAERKLALDSMRQAMLSALDDDDFDELNDD